MKPKTKVVRKKAGKPKEYVVRSFLDSPFAYYSCVRFNLGNELISIDGCAVTPKQARKLAAWLNKAADYLEIK